MGAAVKASYPFKNLLFEQVKQVYVCGAGADEFQETLGCGRIKEGMHEGGFVEGELRIGQVAARVSNLQLAAESIRQSAADCAALLRARC